MWQYLRDWLDLFSETCPIAHRLDGWTGHYFWARGKEGKAAMKEVKKRYKGRFQNARFGGMYITNDKLFDEIYETFSKEFSFPISNWFTLNLSK